MKIGIDARLYQESGIGRYIRNLLFYLQQLDTKNEYYVFLLTKDFETVEFKKNFHKVEANFKWYGIEEQLKFPKLLNKYNLDILHVPHFNIPIFYKGNFIVTIHDLIHQHVDMRRATTHNILFYKVKRLAYKKVFRTAVAESKKIITVSHFVEEQLKKEWFVPEKKIVVTYEGVEDNLLEIIKRMTEPGAKNIISNLNVTPPYIFYVGNAHPHKNIETLIKAFLNIRKKYQYLTLVLSGNENYFWKRIKEEYKHKDIIYTGKISDEQLIALYKKAECFVIPSLEEGFGIPVLEAMAAECPVISSMNASLPEIGGDSAVYFDPQKQEELEAKIIELLDNKKMQKQLKEKGVKHFKKFSWEKLAGETLGVYEGWSG